MLNETQSGKARRRLLHSMRCHRVGLSPCQAEVLLWAYLHDGEWVSQHGLARELGRSRSSVMTALGKLGGLVFLAYDGEAWRRRMALRLTCDGRKIVGWVLND